MAEFQESQLPFHLQSQFKQAPALPALRGEVDPVSPWEDCQKATAICPTETVTACPLVTRYLYSALVQNGSGPSSAISGPQMRTRPLHVVLWVQGLLV